MTKQPQSRDELLAHLAEQRLFLRHSSDAYDNGHLSEAKRLAVALRVLMQDGPHSSTKSLLGQLELLRDLRMLDTGQRDPEPQEVSRAMGLGFVHARLAPQRVDYVPALGNSSGELRPHCDTESWWTRPLTTDAKQSNWSRKAVVLCIANQDGGAHVDKSLRQDYADLSRNNSLGGLGNGEPIRGWELAVVRQVAHEMLETLDRELPRLLTPTELSSAQPPAQTPLPDLARSGMVGSVSLHLGRKED